MDKEKFYISPEEKYKRKEKKNKRDYYIFWIGKGEHYKWYKRKRKGKDIEKQKRWYEFAIPSL